MACAEPQPVPLAEAEAMAGRREVWERLAARHDLVSTPYADLVGWEFGEFIFTSAFDNVTSTIKLRQAGFGDCLDTGDRFCELFDRLAADRVIPPRPDRRLV